jgi:SAM-dependent methyltransferase
MHPTALAGFRRMLAPIAPLGPPGSILRVLDVGGADVNGTVHDALRDSLGSELGGRTASIDVLDIAPGEGVTIVGDATDYGTWDRIDRDAYDLVISTETFEHVERWHDIVLGVLGALKQGGWFVGTCASLGRRPHGARGEHNPPEGEYYRNVSPSDLVMALSLRFDGPLVVEYNREPLMPTTHDVYWRVQK